LQEVVTLTGSSFSASPEKPAFQRSILSNLTLKRWNNLIASKEADPVACLSGVDLSEADPHGSALFRIRSRRFLPKQDRSELFNPGEKPFISHLVEQT